MYSKELEELIRSISSKYQYISSEQHLNYHSFEELIDSIINYYEEIINCMPGNVYWLSKNGHALGCNKNVLDMFGFKSFTEFRGLSFEGMGKVGNWTVDATQKFKQDTFQVLSTGKPILNTEEPPIPHSHGKLIYFLTSRVPLFDKKGKVIGVVGISIDVTERKQMEQALLVAKEEAEIASYAKTEFISNMSHDIRTPLNGVIGVAELLRQMGASNIDREYGQMIYLSSKQLLELLNSVLDVVSVDQINENDIRLETFDLQDLLKQLKDLMLPSIKTKNIQLLFNVDSDIPNYILSDKLKIKRILQNLLGNATKFTNKGSINVNVHVIEKTKDSVKIEFSVQDSGIGISDSQKPHIFDRFFRATPSYEGVYQGHGVGLFIVKKFAALLGSEVHVHSEIGKGSTFSFVLTVNIGNAQNLQTLPDNLELDFHEIIEMKPSTIQKPASHDSTAEPGKTLNVLFIEDNTIARHTGHLLLQNAGCIVHPVENAETALMLIKKQPFDVIITDLGLPGMQGDEMVSILRYWEKKSGKKPMPILALTAHADNKIKNDCLIAGINQVYIKPLDDKLSHIILKQVQKINENITSAQDFSSNTLAIDSQSDNKFLGENIFHLDDIPLLDEQEGLVKTGGEELLKDMLIMTMKKIIPEEIANLKTAYASHNWEEIQKISHKIKGGAVYCGTTRMIHACQFMEQYLENNQSYLSEKLYQQLISIMGQTQQAIISWLNKKNY